MLGRSDIEPMQRANFLRPFPWIDRCVGPPHEQDSHTAPWDSEGGWLVLDRIRPLDHR